MSEVIINNTRVKLEGGEIYSYFKWGISKVCKWYLLKGSINKCSGYRQIRINKKNYAYHRIMYKIHNHEWDITDVSPNNYIDHIDRDKLNNNIDNLRVVSARQNQFNTNCKGYYWHNKSNKWRAQLQVNGKTNHLGLFDVEQDARNAYLAAKKIYHIIV